ncbi:MAG: hypothetical protein K6F15_02455 [Treponema sp.]|nr:hypothetical protein [Treponema sp.]
MQIVHDFSNFIDSRSCDKTQSVAYRLALGGTGLVWLIIMLIMAISPVFKKPEHYKTVQIMLEPIEKAEPSKIEKSSSALSKVTEAKAKEASAPKKANSHNTSTKTQSGQSKATKSPAQSASAKNQPKASPVKSQSAPAKASQPAKSSESPNVKAVEQAAPQKKAVIKYKKSMDELMEEQLSSSSKSAESFNWDDFDDNASVSTSQNQNNSKVSKIDTSAALSGSAGSSSSKDTGVQSSTGKEYSSTATASDSTKAFLSQIAKTEFTGSGGNGLSTKSEVSAARSNDGKIALSLSDGSARILLEPKEPKIYISEENSKLIDSSRTVTIVFGILSTGEVPLTDISFKPEAVLPGEIKSEIRAQIAKWRFAPASTKGQATFDFSIIKR